MPIKTTYSNARNNLASLLNQVTDDREIVVINRRGREDVAMVTASELSSLLETEYLFRSQIAIAEQRKREYLGRIK